MSLRRPVCALLFAFALVVAVGAGSAAGGGVRMQGASTASVADLAVTTSDDVVNGDVSSPEALLADPGPDGISLREAILAADNAGGRQTITFSPALGGETIAPQQTYNVNQPGITIQGSLTDPGQPAVTLTGSSISGAFLFGVYASEFAISGLRMTDMVGVAAINVDAGETFSPRLIHDVTIENNVFDNSLSPNGAHAIYLSMPSTASEAEISNVAIIGNSFAHFFNGSDGVLAAVSGSNDVIRDVEVEGNAFSDTTFPVEFVGANAVNSRIEGARVVRNTFTSSLQPVNINQIGTDGQPATTANVIDGTLVAKNVFRNNRGPDVVILGGMTNATNNSITNTRIQDNLMTGSTQYGGVGIVGGRQESAGNLIDGVQLANNTIVQNVGGGAGIRANLDGGSGNVVTGVTALNSIMADNGGTDFDGIGPSQVSFSLTNQSGYAGANGNIGGDPEFIDPANGDFHLQAGSPAVDAGTSDGASSTDLECRGRVGLPDMGAFEYGGAPATCPPPSTTIDAHPPSSTSLQNAELSFESNIASSTFECRLDSGNFAVCTSPENYSGLTEGPHVFQVRAVDPDGNWDPAPATFSWAVDPAAPAPPAISGFSPGSAGAHATVTVTGTSFTGTTSVTLNGTSVPFSVTSNTRLTFTVPAGAASGAITVVTPAGSATSTGTLTIVPPPTITSISPGSGPIGTSVTVAGTNLQDAVGVEIGSIVTVPTSVALDGSQLTFTVPPGAASGTVRILARNGSATSADTFTVTG